MGRGWASGADGAVSGSPALNGVAARVRVLEGKLSTMAEKLSLLECSMQQLVGGNSVDIEKLLVLHGEQGNVEAKVVVDAVRGSLGAVSPKGGCPSLYEGTNKEAAAEVVPPCRRQLAAHDSLASTVLPDGGIGSDRDDDDGQVSVATTEPFDEVLEWNDLQQAESSEEAKESEESMQEQEVQQSGEAQEAVAEAHQEEAEALPQGAAAPQQGAEAPQVEASAPQAEADSITCIAAISCCEKGGAFVSDCQAKVEAEAPHEEAEAPQEEADAHLEAAVALHEDYGGYRGYEGYGGYRGYVGYGGYCGYEEEAESTQEEAEAPLEEAVAHQEAAVAPHEEAAAPVRAQWLPKFTEVFWRDYESTAAEIAEDDWEQWQKLQELRWDFEAFVERQSVGLDRRQCQSG